MIRTKREQSVVVDGGEYSVATWDGSAGGAIVLAVHGITGSHLSWPPVIEHLDDDLTVHAPDLRGRGANSGLAGPYGLDCHVRDLLRVLDALELDKVVLAGHSLGAYIGLQLAVAAPDRLHGLVLVDGGIALPMREGADPDEVIKAVLGPTLARLDMEFESRADYQAFWRQHPAFQDEGAWNPFMEAYVDYDLIGEPPHFHSRVNRIAVLEDGRGPLSPHMPGLIDRVNVPMLLLTAPRGLLNQADPLLPAASVAAKAAALDHLDHAEVADTNHYTIVTGSGAERTARHLEAFTARVTA